MACSQALKFVAPHGALDVFAHYWREGYAIVRGFFSPQEVMEIAAAADQVYAEAAAHGRSFRHGNLFYNVAAGPSGTPLVRMAQWPSYHQPVLNKVRLDSRIARLLEPLIGRNLKQIINQIHWKVPGSLGDFAWHHAACASSRPAICAATLAWTVRGRPSARPCAMTPWKRSA